MSSTENHDTPGPPRWKAVLICQSCGHESHVDGDWTTVRSADGYALECPDCDHDVLDRRRTSIVACAR